MRRIDAHQHCWRLERGDYGWLRPGDPATQALYRDFLPADLLPLLQANAVSQTVLIQAAASEAETDYLLTLATGHDWIAGVVGWVDLSDPAAVASLKCWRHNAKFKGLRPMLQDLARPDWIATQPHAEVLAAMRQFGLRLDALVRPAQLPALLNFVRRNPSLAVVIDHAAKPDLTNDLDAADGWRRDMAALAAHPQVFCKFSGLMGASAEQLRAVWGDLLRWFGPQRLMWGSDWPVLTLDTSYADCVARSAALIAELSQEDQARLWRGTATEFYGLDPVAP